MNHLRRPLVVALLAFLAGLLPFLRFDLPLLPSICLFFAIFAADVTRRTGWLHITSSHQRLLVPLLLGAAGAVVGGAARTDSASDCRAHLQDDLALEVRGSLGATHRAGAAGFGSPLLPLVSATVSGAGGCGGEMRIRMPPATPDLPTGARIVVDGHWRTFNTTGLPSQWPRDPRFYGFIRADSVAVDSTAAGRPSLWLRLRAVSDNRLAELFPDHLPMVEALLLGRREYMDPAIRDRFTRSGLSHILAISGMHVGLLAAALLLIASVLRLSRIRAIQVTFVATWVYLLVIGAGPSAIRSGVMISLALFAFILQRPSAPTTIVATAAFAILAFNPLAILDPGFQLSFAGVLSIVLLRGPLLTLAPDQLQRRGMLRNVTDAIVVGLAAFVVTAPIVAHHFQTVAPISIVAGIPAVPLMSLALIGAAAALLIDPLVPPVADLLASGAGAALDALDWVAGLAAAVPFGNGSVPPPPIWQWSVAALTGVLIARWAIGGATRLRWITGLGSTTFVLIAWPLLASDTPDGIEVHFIDVGQGDAIAIRTPADRWVLIDAGPASDDYDAGARNVVPFLRGRGADRIEAFVLTHPDLDHIGGAPAVLAAIPVEYLFEPGLPVGKSSYLELIGSVETHGAEWRAVRTGRTMDLDGVHFQFLWPDPETLDAATDANQISAVALVTYGAFSLLLTGDAGVDVEDRIVDRHFDSLDVDVLKLGHHGSTTSTSERFLDATRPELTIVSAGRRNRYGHPAPPVLRRLERRGIPVARTDRDGTVSLIVSQGGSEWRRQEL